MKLDVDIITKYPKTNIDEYFMGKALNEAKKCFETDDVPVGALIVKDGIIISIAHNERNKNMMVTDHAEVLAIRKACKKLNRWILDDCILYVTVEPCFMCSSTILQARIKKVVFGCFEPKTGCAGSTYNCLNNEQLKSKVEITPSILDNESRILLQYFFRNLRKK